MSYEVDPKTLKQNPPTTASEIQLHPIVVMSIIGHYTSFKNPARATTDRRSLPFPIGAITGKVSRRPSHDVVEVGGMFEFMPFDEASSNVPGAPLFDHPDCQQRAQLYSRSFVDAASSMDVVGWYAVAPTLPDETLFAQIQAEFTNLFGTKVAELMGTPLVLVVDATGHQEQPQQGAAEGGPAVDVGRLPVYMFEAESSLSTPPQLVTYHILSDPGESIGMNTASNIELANFERHAAGAASSSTKSALDPHVARLQLSSGMLRERAAVLLRYVVAVQQGFIKNPDPELLRAIVTVALRLSVTPSAAYTNARATVAIEDLSALYSSLLTRGGLEMVQLLHSMEEAAPVRHYKKLPPPQRRRGGGGGGDEGGFTADDGLAGLAHGEDWEA